MEDLGRAALKQASKSRTRQNGRSGTNPNTIASVSAGNNATTEEGITDNAIETATAVCKAQVDPRDPSGGVQDKITPSESAPSLIDCLSPELSLSNGYDPSISPDWLNFDAAFENFDAVLGNSGADISMELLRPFNFEDFGAFGLPESGV